VIEGGEDQVSACRAHVGGALVLVDVDGPLIPFRARPVRWRSTSPSGLTHAPERGGHPLLDRLDPEDGRRLSAPGRRLVWATTWGSDANEVISPRLGLPELPVVEWPDDDDGPAGGLHWKTASLTRWAAGRPFVWLDDEMTDIDRERVASHHPGRALLWRVDPYVGLAEADFVAVNRWLQQR
jgi:hypothetical protein